MANSVWKAEDSVYDIMRMVIAKNHADLASVVDEITIIFREKARKSGGRKVYGRAFRASDLMNVLSENECKFVIELAAEGWEHELTAKQREALMDHCLTMCRCDIDDSEGGEEATGTGIKCSIGRPDISAFAENLERYGYWFPVDRSETSPEPAAVDAIMGAVKE